MIFIWISLIIAAYLLGSVPVSYLAAKSRGVDLRQEGSKQVGGGNLWRTTSRKLGLLSGFFDFIKGMAMVWVAYLLGLGVDQQIVVGLAAVVGHDWPVFLRFHGGRGIATSLGIVIILPFLDDLSPWPMAAALIVIVAGALIMRRTHIPVLGAAVFLPLVAWWLHQPLPVTMGYLAISLIAIVKRLTAQPIVETISNSKSQLLLNRLLYDRDIRDRSMWINGKPAVKKEQKEG